jgi:hypothetical protein
MTQNYLDVQENNEIITRDEYQAKKKSESKKNEKKISATNLGRLKEKSYNDVIKVMKQKEYISDKNTITEKGLSQGIEYKENKQGNKWIVYPESLNEIL